MSFDKERIKALRATLGGVLAYLKNCKTVGLGSGRTISYILKEIDPWVKAKGLNLTFVPSSLQVMLEVQRLGLNLASSLYTGSVDLTIDGADEVDFNARAIKGGGGALIGERILAHMSRKYVIVVDEFKLSEIIGLKSMVPVEVVSDGYSLMVNWLRRRGFEFKLRMDEKGYPKLSAAGNLMVDVKLPPKLQPREFFNLVKMVPGVVDVGIFLSDEITEIIVGRSNGTIERIKGNREKLN